MKRFEVTYKTAVRNPEDKWSKEGYWYNYYTVDDVKEAEEKFWSEMHLFRIEAKIIEINEVTKRG